MAKGVKIFQKYDEYKYYKIEGSSDKYYVKRFESMGIISDDWEDIGSARSFEYAVSLARVDALKYGSIYKVEFD